MERTLNSNGPFWVKNLAPWRKVRLKPACCLGALDWKPYGLRALLCMFRSCSSGFQLTEGLISEACQRIPSRIHFSRHL